MTKFKAVLSPQAKALGITRIYDNGGETLDRYSVYTSTVYSNLGKQKTYQCLALSENATGYSEFCGGMLGPHNGKLITFESLPLHVQNHIIARLTPDNS